MRLRKVNRLHSISEFIMEGALTVSEFVEIINEALAAAAGLTVEGEVDEYKVIQGKWVTFRLKDETSSVGCFMPVWDLHTAIEDGMLVRVTGIPKLREKGFFSFVLSTVQPAGEGSLKRAFELLRKKLEDEGLFSVERKRPLPRFPQHIALVTSRDAAAYSDFIKVLQGRIGGLTVSFIHTQVQGEDAPNQLIRALEQANTDLADVDAIVMIRGGGSLEDLQAFNDEVVVRAVAASRTPTIIGIGHERDITLAELAADLRASTPSNAAELLVRSREELFLQLSGWQKFLSSRTQEILQQQRHTIEHSVSVLKNQMRATIAHVDQLVRILKSLSPEETLKRGYSITRTVDGEVIKTTRRMKQGDVILTTLARGKLKATVQMTND